MPTSSKATDAVHDFHARPADQVLEALGVAPERGLDNEQATQRLRTHGPNTIMSRRKASALRVLLHQLKSPVVYLLAAAAALGFYFDEVEEGAAIVAVLAINTAIGFFTELRAARSIEALRALGTRNVRVRRDGRVHVIPAEQLVPGDIVVLEAGDSIAADLRLIEASNLAVDESTLTGESVAVEKQVAPVAVDARLADRASALFKGTVLTRGSGTAVVAATGLETELGRISRLVEEAEPGSSPLEEKLARLSGQLVWATIILAAVIAGVGLASGKNPLLMIEAAIALAVASIPEGLPIVATLALARGMWRMAHRNALIERLSAVETLGATTIILTDKTGTLTENRMTVRRFWLPEREVEVPGNGAGAAAGPHDADDPQLARLIDVTVRCNDAALDGADDKGSGDPMELALLRAGLRYGLRRGAVLAEKPLVRKHAFDTSTRMMATVHRDDGRHDSGRYLVAVKGAPEAVLGAAACVAGAAGASAMSTEVRAEWLDRVEALGQQGLRVLAGAYKITDDPDAPPYEDLTFAGLIGLEDPPRNGVAEAIADCQRAGIRVVMVTGDHAVTARSVARSVGLGAAAIDVVDGREVGRLLADGGRLPDVGVFSRVNPAEKLQLVRAYQADGAVVAMTGDGVNDAPALRQADIGVAMGLRGTDVARQAAAMILLDDAFPTIVRAIREGRVVFGNIRRFVTYLLSCNMSEVMVVGLAVLSALPLPLMPLQILYLNLVTDVFPAFALAMGEGERDILDRPPRDPREPILGRPQWVAIILQGLVLTAATFAALAAATLWAGLDDRAVVTVTFLTLAFAQIWHVFNMRGPRSHPLSNEVTRNPWVWAATGLCVLLLAVPPYVPFLARVLHLVPPTPVMWTIVLAASLAPVVVGQAVRQLMAARRRSAAP